MQLARPQAEGQVGQLVRDDVGVRGAVRRGDALVAGEEGIEGDEGGVVVQEGEGGFFCGVDVEAGGEGLGGGDGEGCCGG